MWTGFKTELLFHAGKNTYYSTIIYMSEYYNFPCFDLTYLTDGKIKHYVNLTQQKFEKVYFILVSNILYNTLTKLEFFNTFMNDYTLSSYLGLTSKLSERKGLVKFRIGNHKLMIETGRYDQIIKLCPI